jgi:hypothetical protein
MAVLWPCVPAEAVPGGSRVEDVAVKDPSKEAPAGSMPRGSARLVAKGLRSRGLASHTMHSLLLGAIRDLAVLLCNHLTREHGRLVLARQDHPLLALSRGRDGKRGKSEAPSTGRTLEGPCLSGGGGDGAAES